MPTVNLAGNSIVYSFGAIIALVILITAIVLMAIGQTITPFLLLLFIAGLALARLT